MFGDALARSSVCGVLYYILLCECNFSFVRLQFYWKVNKITKKKTIKRSAQQVDQSVKLQRNCASLQVSVCAICKLISSTCPSIIIIIISIQ